MRRREFIAGLGGAAAWPVVVRAQQSERMRRVGVFMPYAEGDPGGQTRFQAFRRGLADLGWVEGHNFESAPTRIQCYRLHEL
jgi:putative tryptophan/tyrosine transport system substrate-binding protein